MPSFEVQSGEALEKVAAGQPISWDSFAPDLDGAPSPNRWLLANVAKGLELARRAVAKLASARAAAEDQLQRIARQVASWALWAGEDRSPDYNGMHMRPILGAWVAAETLGLTQVADILRRTFRAMLAHIALSAVPGQARKFSEQELLSPMRAGNLREFKVLNIFGAIKMATFAKVGKVAMAVKSNFRVFRKIVNNFDFEFFPFGVPILTRVVA
jgi:hypothetical protein